MLQRIENAAREAPEYDSLKALRADARRMEHKTFGWVDGDLYEVWPGGRAVKHRDASRPLTGQPLGDSDDITVYPPW